MSHCEHHKPRVWLVHGFNVRDGGAGTTGRLIPYLEEAGYEVKVFRYGWLRLPWVRFLNKYFAKILASIIEDGDIIMAHSNGCTIASIATEMGAPISQFVVINGALDADRKFAPQIKRIHVWHSPSDKPVRWARFLYKHRWGALGATGYVGPEDDRVTNYNKEDDYALSSSEHSDVFKDKNLREYFAPRIINPL